VSNAVKFTPTGGLLRVSLDVSRFEVNPLAVIASDQLLHEINGGPADNKPSRSSHARASWLQAPTQAGMDVPPVATPVDSSAVDGGVGGVPGTSPICGKQPRPPILIPELLGTVMVRVAVKDTGPGIPVDWQSQIFSAYMSATTCHACMAQPSLTRTRRGRV